MAAILIPVTAASQTQKQGPADAPEGKTIVAEKPDQDFETARQDFLKKNWRGLLPGLTKP